MPIAYSGVITFQRNTKRSRSPIYYVPSLQALETFATQIQGLSNAGIYKVTFVTTNKLDTLENPNTTQMDGMQACIMFKRSPPDPDEAYPYKEFPVYCPKIEILENVPGQGWRVKKTIGDQLAAAYSRMTGKTYIFEHGWVK